MRDFFEPQHQPAKDIYLAFQDEAAKRKGRKVEEWRDAEASAVWRKAAELSSQMNLRAVTLEEVMTAERSAYGSADYGSKWALRVAESMRKGA